MIGEFETAVIEVLNKDEIKADKYYGELIDPKKFQFNQKDLPMVYVDYIGDDPDSPIRKEYKFNLYIAHISYSKHKNTRQQKHQEIYSLLNEIDKRLDLKSFENSEPIKMGKTQKIFDAVTNEGYLTVYRREFTATLKNY